MSWACLACTNNVQVSHLDSVRCLKSWRLKTMNWKCPRSQKLNHHLAVGSDLFTLLFKFLSWHRQLLGVCSLFVAGYLQGVFISILNSFHHLYFDSNINWVSCFPVYFYLGFQIPIYLLFKCFVSMFSVSLKMFDSLKII